MVRLLIFSHFLLPFYMYRLLSVVNDDRLILKALFIIIADIIFAVTKIVYNNGDKICHRKRIIKNKKKNKKRKEIAEIITFSKRKKNNSFRKLI